MMAGFYAKNGPQVFDRPIEIGSNKTDLTKAEHLTALKYGSSFLDEGGRRFHMIVCLARSGVMHGLEIKALR